MHDQMARSIGDSRGSTTMPPKWVFSLVNPVTRLLLRLGVPMGLNGLITIAGRKTGIPRTTPIAIIEHKGTCSGCGT